MTTNETSIDPVLRLARRVARRADQIAYRQPMHDLEAWLRAEEEVLGIRLPRPHLGPATARRQVATLSSR